MNKIRRILSLLGCCLTADNDMEPCCPEACFNCSKTLDKMNTRIKTLEKRMFNVEKDLRTLPKYKQAVDRYNARGFRESEIAENHRIYDENNIYADRISELFNRFENFDIKYHRNDEIVGYCWTYLITYRYEFSKEEDRLLPSQPKSEFISCQCQNAPIIKELHDNVLFNLLVKMDLLDAKLLKCLNRTKATYPLNYRTEEDQEQQAVDDVFIAETTENQTKNENPILKSLSNKEQRKNKCYPMNNKFRGRCIYFGHAHFTDPKKDRRDIMREEKLVAKTFRNMGFKYKAYIDLDYKQIVKVLKKLAKKNFKDDDCICILISTHGESGDFLWARDERYPFDIFESKLANIKSLVNKPKLFFIQACRGAKVDYGMPMNEVSASSSSSAEDETDGNNKYFTKVPIKADFLKVFSSPPGFLSWRGWFFRELCNNFEKFSEKYDVETIVKITANDIRALESNCTDKEKNGAKQALYVEHTLSRTVFLKKK